MGKTCLRVAATAKAGELLFVVLFSFDSPILRSGQAQLLGKAKENEQ